MRRSWTDSIAPPGGVRNLAARVALAAALLPVVLLPAPTFAQDPEIDFPVTTSGRWEGRLEFSGSLSIDNASDDGSFVVKISDVIGSTSIPVDLNVSPDGTVDGTMVVYLEWFAESAGDTPLGRPYHVQTDHVQTGTLSLSGTAARLVAQGVVDYETITAAEGGIIEEVSGTEKTTIEWVFSLSEADCFLVTGVLTETSGLSLLGSALLPPVLHTDYGSEMHNELVAYLRLWPESEATSEAVEAAAEEVAALADQLKQREFPEASHLIALVDVWGDMQAEVAALNECPSAGGFVVPPFDKAWLVTFLQSILDTALESPDHYEARELIDLWDVGTHDNALDGELVVAFLDAFDDKLDEAIAEGDLETINDIAAFASANAYPGLEAKASTALG